MGFSSELTRYSPAGRISATAHTPTATIARTVSALGKGRFFFSCAWGGGVPPLGEPEDVSTGGAPLVEASVAGISLVSSLVGTSLVLIGSVPFEPRIRWRDGLGEEARFPHRPGQYPTRPHPTAEVYDVVRRVCGRARLRRGIAA